MSLRRHARRGQIDRSGPLGRRIAASALAVLLPVAGGAILTVGPSYAKPDIGDVQARVDRLYHKAEQASERYNTVRHELDSTRKQLGLLRSESERQHAKVSAVRDQVAASVVASYQGQALSTASAVFLSDDSDAFLSELTTVSAYNDQQSQLLTAFATEAKRLEVQERSTAASVAKIASAKRTLAAEKARIHAAASEAKDLLADLVADREARIAAARAASRSAAEARQRLAQQSEVAATPSVEAPAPAVESAPVSGRGGAAVSYALAQVGDAYVYGATGDDAFDCSGLTMRAWGAAGVTLPHASSAQIGAGTPVSQSQLQPGDLVFYYSPISHVALYIGNGMIVHAANPSTGVATAPLNSMPYSGAVRPG